MTDDERLQVEYEQAAEWERHYSTVRATVPPTLAGISVAVLGWNWGQNGMPDREVFLLAAFVWLAGFVILWMFSAFVVRERWYARLCRALLLKGQPQGGDVDEAAKGAGDPAPATEWGRIFRRYGEPLRTRYSANNQLNAAHLERLKGAWDVRLAWAFDDAAMIVGTVLTAAYLGLLWWWRFL